MNNKHAYLIMAHDQFAILLELLRDIDDERNDIYLHIDRKSRKVPWEKLKDCVRKSKLYLVARRNVSWGGYSQIECEVYLLECARKRQTYNYYHFLCGSEYPLKNQDRIHDFFDRHMGMEFLEYDEADSEYLKRVKYHYLFNEMGRLTPCAVIKHIKFFIRERYLIWQKKKGVDLTKQYPYVFKKGNANWSITDALADEVIKKKQEIQQIYKKSYCADEVYLHTIVYNSFFYHRVYREAGKTSNARMQQWNREDNCYGINDVGNLVKSSALFARKFLGAEGLKAIYEINRCRNQNED